MEVGCEETDTSYNITIPLSFGIHWTVLVHMDLTWTLFNSCM